MSGLGGAHRNFGSLEVANLTDQHHIRIMPQDRTQPGRKSQPNLLAHLDLDGAFELILDRVFESDHLARFVISLGKGSIKRRRLAAAGGAGEEHETLREPGQFLKEMLLVRFHPQLAEIEKKTLPAKDAQAHSLPKFS